MPCGKLNLNWRFITSQVKLQAQLHSLRLSKEKSESDFVSEWIRKKMYHFFLGQVQAKISFYIT